MASCGWTGLALGPPSCSCTPSTCPSPYNAGTALSLSVPAGSWLFIDACAVQGAVLPAIHNQTWARCGDSGAWGVSAPQGSVAFAVQGFGPFTPWVVPGVLPFEYVQPTASVTVQSDVVAAAPLVEAILAVPQTVALSQVSAIVGGAMRSSWVRAGKGAMVQSNTTADVDLGAAVMSAYSNATVVYSRSSGPGSAPGSVFAFWSGQSPDGRDPLPGVPDTQWGPTLNATAMQFVNAASVGVMTASAAATTAAHTLHDAQSLYGLSIATAPPPPPPPAATPTSNLINIYIPILGGCLGILSGTLAIVTFYRSCRSDRRKSSAKDAVPPLPSTSPAPVSSKKAAAAHYNSAAALGIAVADTGAFSGTRRKLVLD